VQVSLRFVVHISGPLRYVELVRLGCKIYGNLAGTLPTELQQSQPELEMRKMSHHTHNFPRGVDSPQQPRGTGSQSEKHSVMAARFSIDTLYRDHSERPRSPTRKLTLLLVVRDSVHQLNPISFNLRPHHQLPQFVNLVWFQR
jgi:hypothetical protein